MRRDRVRLREPGRRRGGDVRRRLPVPLAVAAGHPVRDPAAGRRGDAARHRAARAAHPDRGAGARRQTTGVDGTSGGRAGRLRQGPGERPPGSAGWTSRRPYVRLRAGPHGHRGAAVRARLGGAADRVGDRPAGRTAARGAARRPGGTRSGRAPMGELEDRPALGLPPIGVQGPWPYRARGRRRRGRGRAARRARRGARRSHPDPRAEREELRGDLPARPRSTCAART
jgi:hypothetical protein